MNLRDEDLERNSLNLEYKNKANEEKFLDDVIRATLKETTEDTTISANPNTSVTTNTNTTTESNSDTDSVNTSPKKKITRDEIYQAILDQAKKIKKDEQQQDKQRTDEQEKNTSQKNMSKKVEYSDVSKTIPWVNEYSKQPIKINENKIRKYLKYYKDLPALMKLREQKIVSGIEKPESSFLQIDELPDLKFLKGTNEEKQNFLAIVDYKMQEMKFYYTNLTLTLAYLKNYMYMGYQFIMLKYCYNFTEKQLREVTNYTNMDKLDKVLIDYIYKKLLEESKKIWKS